MKNWVDRLKCPAFIIGNGPSLNQIDLSLLSDYFTIGINRAFRLIDPTVLIWQDISLWNTESNNLKGLQAIKVAADGSDPKRMFHNFHIKSGGYKFVKTTHILYGRGSTGPLAVQLAYAMGCRPIVLLGMDCCKSENGDTDFYGVNKFWSENTLTYCKSGLLAIKNNCPVQVYNCSNNDVWPKRELSDVIKEIDPDGEWKSNRDAYKNILTNHKNAVQ